MHAAPPLLFLPSRSSCRLQTLLKRRDIKCTNAGSGKSGFHNKYVHNNNKNQKNLHHKQNRAGKERGEPRALGLVTRMHAAPPLLFPLSRSSCRLQTLLKRRHIKCTDAGSGKSGFHNKYVHNNNNNKNQKLSLSSPSFSPCPVRTVRYFVWRAGRGTGRGRAGLSLRFVCGEEEVKVPAPPCIS